MSSSCSDSPIHSASRVSHLVPTHRPSERTRTQESTECAHGDGVCCEQCTGFPQASWRHAESMRFPPRLLYALPLRSKNKADDAHALTVFGTHTWPTTTMPIKG